MKTIGFQTIADKLFSLLMAILTLFSVVVMGLVVFYLIYQAIPLFTEISPIDFVLGQRWTPVDFGAGTSFGIFNFICATVFVSLLALTLAFLVSVGTALFLSCSASRWVRAVVLPSIELLAGVPSVVFGFIGLVVVAKLFLEAGSPTGTCVLAASIVLAVMIVPFLVSSITETMVHIRERHMPSSSALGVSYWHGVAHVVLPLSAPSFFPSMILAFGRAMGETIAVMMVIGNANVFPTLLGKGETLPSVLALEMGTAVVESSHYHALFAAALVLLLLLFIIDALAAALNKKLLGRGRYAS